MKITNYIQSPNYSCQQLDAKLIVIHWTAGNIHSAVNWFLNPKSKASAHFLIDTNGRLLQMVDTDTIAWHAGKSNLPGYSTYGIWNSLNPCSIGIELEGRPSDIGETCWQHAQIKACAHLCSLLHKEYPNLKITDHSSICPGKIDVKHGIGNDFFPWGQLMRCITVPEEPGHYEL